MVGRTYEEWYEKYKNNHIKVVKKRLNRIKEWYNNLKLTQKCEMCQAVPTEKQLINYHFHHKDPETKVSTISDMVRSGFSIAKIEEEMKKCEFLCKDCHDAVTWT